MVEQLATYVMGVLRREQVNVGPSIDVDETLLYKHLHKVSKASCSDTVV